MCLPQRPGWGEQVFLFCFSIEAAVHAGISFPSTDEFPWRCVPKTNSSKDEFPPEGKLPEDEFHPEDANTNSPETNCAPKMNFTPKTQSPKMSSITEDEFPHVYIVADNHLGP